jgi:hypothetical protein
MLTKRQLAWMLLFFAGIAVAGQDKASSPASLLSGSITVGAGEGNLLGSPYASDIPGFSTTLSTASVALKFSDAVSHSYLDVIQTADEIYTSTRFGYEAGVVFDAANLYAFTAPTSKYGSNGDSSFYNLIQSMIDWYESNRGRFGLAGSPYPTGVWPTDNYDGSPSGRTRFIYGSTVEPITVVAWDFTKWYDAQKLYSEIKLKIELAIDDISAEASSGRIIDQYAYQTLPLDKKALAQKEIKAWNDFRAISEGVDTKAALSGPLIQSAYLRFTNIGGLLDARLDFAGAKVSSGSLVPSTRLDQPATGPALALALPVGLLPGFSLSAKTSLVGGAASVIENFETKNLEALPGEPSWLGLQLKGGYRVADTTAVSVSLLWPDLASRPLTLASTLEAKVAQKGELSYTAALEGNFLLWQDRYLQNPPNVIAYSGGLDAAGRIFGLAPRLLTLYKSAGFWGTGGNDSEDRFPGAELRGDFNAAKVKDALAIEAGLGFDPAFLIDLDLVSVDAGYRVLLYDLASGVTAPLGQGWYANLSIGLLDALHLPLRLAANATNYTNWGIYAGRYSDWNKAPAAGLLTGLTFGLEVDWDPSREIRVSFEASGRDSGWRMDTQKILAAAMKASIKF